MAIQVPGRKAPQRIDVVLNDVDNNVRCWVDVTKIHEMGKTSQEKRRRQSGRARRFTRVMPGCQPKQEYTTLKPRLRTPR